MSNLNTLQTEFDTLLHGFDLISDITTYFSKLDIDIKNMRVSNHADSNDIITISIDNDDTISPLISTVKYDLRTYYNKEKLRNIESELSFTAVLNQKTIQKAIIINIDINYCSDGNIIWFSDCDFYFKRLLAK